MSRPKPRVIASGVHVQLWTGSTSVHGSVWFAPKQWWLRGNARSSESTPKKNVFFESWLTVAYTGFKSARVFLIGLRHFDGCPIGLFAKKHEFTVKLRLADRLDSPIPWL